MQCNNKFHYIANLTFDIFRIFSSNGSVFQEDQQDLFDAKGKKQKKIDTKPTIFNIE